MRAAHVNSGIIYFYILILLAPGLSGCDREPYLTSEETAMKYFEAKMCWDYEKAKRYAKENFKISSVSASIGMKKKRSDIREFLKLCSVTLINSTEERAAVLIHIDITGYPVPDMNVDRSREFWPTPREFKNGEMVLVSDIYYDLELINGRWKVSHATF